MAAKKSALLIIYGRGGHKEQMKRLLKIMSASSEFEFVSIADIQDEFGALEHHLCPEPRDKFHIWKAPWQLLLTALSTFISTIRLVRKYDISGVVSTGPGMSVMPSLLMKLLGKKIVYVESWSRFYTCSATGLVMYRIADKFYVQNESMIKEYPNAIYSGRL